MWGGGRNTPTLAGEVGIHTRGRRFDKNDVERRKEVRILGATPVTVKVLGILPQPPMAGRVLDMSGSGLRVEVPLPIPCGASVRVETADTLMLGDVCRCEPRGDRYAVGLMLSHSLDRLLDLERLNRALLGRAPMESLVTRRTHLTRA